MHKGCKRRGRMGHLARAKTGVGARQLKSWRANFDLASKKLASTQKTHILHHNNKATQPKAVKYQ